MQDLTVFISYSWDSQELKEWVRKLADYLIEKGSMDVILDQYDLKVGKVMTYFMESSIERADKVLLILTPGYKAKAESGKAGVSYEHSIITTALFDIQNDNTKFIPVLRTGNKSTSSPGYVKALIYHDMTSDDKFESDAFNLVKVLYEEPEISKPVKGSKPDLTQSFDPVLEQARNLANSIQLAEKVKAYANSYDAVNQIANELKELFKCIKDKSIEYKSLTELFIKSDYKDHRCILNINDVGLNIYYKYSFERPIEQNELIVSVWDKYVLMDSSEYYFPGDEPKEIWSTIFKPRFTTDLHVIWSNNNEQLLTKALNGYIYSTLFEFVRKKRT